MRKVSANTISTRVADGMYAHVDEVTLDKMEAAGVAYTARVSWFADNSGRMIGSVTCSCTSGDCSESGTCENGNITCNCVTCDFSCS